MIAGAPAEAIEALTPYAVLKCLLDANNTVDCRQAPDRRSQRYMQPLSLPAATTSSLGPTNATSFTVSQFWWPP